MPFLCACAILRSCKGHNIYHYEKLSPIVQHIPSNHCGLIAMRYFYVETLFSSPSLAPPLFHFLGPMHHNYDACNYL